VYTCFDCLIESLGCASGFRVATRFRQYPQLRRGISAPPLDVYREIVTRTRVLEVCS
jgi:hypothetical protein